MEEIEILDLDDNNIKKKIDNKKTVKSKKRKEKQKRKMTKKEKVFLLCNILVILGIIGVYAYRTVHYYKLSHNVVTDVTLKEKLTTLDKLSFQNDGLYEEDKTFYFKGSDVNNYVYYSGRMFRIIDINNGIRMIEDETGTNLVWNVDGNFNDSLINNWLKSYLETLMDYDVYLKQNDWCNTSIDIENYNCSDTISSYVGLVSTKDYLKAGGKTSYLNNKTYYWTINQDKDGKVFYVNDEGSINNLSNNEDNYFSYGIRPVITLKEDVMYISGNGSKNDPYIIEELGKALLKDNSVGSFVKYNNYDFRILSTDEDGTRLILNKTLDESKNYSDALKYLNNNFLKEFKKEELVKQNYYSSEYNYANKYNYKTEKITGNEYVIMPQIGDLFLNDAENYWLSNIQDSKLGLLYTVDDNHMLFADLKGNKHNLRPIIKVNKDMVVSSGIGTVDNPLIIGENDEETVE